MSNGGPESPAKLQLTANLPPGLAMINPKVAASPDAPSRVHAAEKGFKQCINTPYSTYFLRFFTDYTLQKFAASSPQ